MRNFSILYFIFLLLILTNCSQPNNNQVVTKYYNLQGVSYAISYDLRENIDSWMYIKKSTHDSVIQVIPKNILPFKKMVILSSPALGYLETLNALDHVQVVFNPQWIYSPTVHQKLETQEIHNGGNAASANYETILMHDPDVIIAFTDPNQAKWLKGVEKLGIPILYIDEYQETTPLGKSEYLKLFGVIVGEKNKADSLFSEIEKEYIATKNLAQERQLKPTVFSDIMRGDVWYMPGGKSFASQYLLDAGGDYVWKESTKNGTENLNFEQVYAKARDAQIWVNAADFTTKEQLKNTYKNHYLFTAFQQNRVYSVAKRGNAEGANDYFETGTVRCDWVLKDLVKIFHPEILPKHELVFYHRLE